jgi:hypothetical protein
MIARKGSKEIQRSRRGLINEGESAKRGRHFGEQRKILYGDKIDKIVTHVILRTQIDVCLES